MFGDDFATGEPVGIIVFISVPIVSVSFGSGGICWIVVVVVVMMMN